MLIGLFVKNYKTYNGTTFIPFIQDDFKNLCLIIGENGVGKSSVLEALDSFFNLEIFSIHNGSDKSDCFVSPVFLFKKEDLDFTPSGEKIANELSEYFWNLPSESSIQNLVQFKSISNFFQFVSRLKENFKESEYYLITIDLNASSPKTVEFGTFKDFLFKKIHSVHYAGEDDFEKFKKEYQKKSIELIRKKLIEKFSYLYIPIETSLSQFLKIETQGMQKLMNQDIQKDISNIIMQKIEINGSNSNIEDHLNNKLDEFINDIEEKIKTINTDYNFQIESGWKRLTAANIRDKIVEAYLAKRELKLKKQSIRELSSGERRKALIDVAYAFLKDKDDTKKERISILAIDEPESSLHVSLSFKQFKRLQELSEEHSNHIFITSHWYGSLPLIQKGTLLNITKSTKPTPNISIFDFNDYFNAKKHLPDEISLKSYFDLTSSIFTSLRTEGDNWLICEGPDDKNYLKYYLSDKIENLNIICVGGCGNVLKLYKYLKTPIDEEIPLKKAKHFIKGKALFLIDSDNQRTKLGDKSASENGIVKIARLQAFQDEIKLFDIDSVDKTEPTEMEDSLIPKQFYQALSLAISQFGSLEEKTAFSNFDFNECAKLSRLKGENNILKLNSLERQIENKKIVSDFLEDHYKKFITSEKYIELERIKTPTWVNDIIEFFK
jgi:ABC-type Mn2+/Zn2+ transport system ATPase subunit